MAARKEGNIKNYAGSKRFCCGSLSFHGDFAPGGEVGGEREKSLGLVAPGGVWLGG